MNLRKKEIENEVKNIGALLDIGDMTNYSYNFDEPDRRVNERDEENARRLRICIVCLKDWNINQLRLFQDTFEKGT